MCGIAASTRLAAAALLALALGGPAAAAESYRFMSGPQGGSWYPLAGAIANFARDTLDDVTLRACRVLGQPRTTPQGGVITP